MINKEKVLEMQILQRKTTEKWSKAGLLEGLTGDVNENIAKLFQNEDPRQIVDD